MVDHLLPKPTDDEQQLALASLEFPFDNDMCVGQKPTVQHLLVQLMHWKMLRKHPQPRPWTTAVVKKTDGLIVVPVSPRCSAVTPWSAFFKPPSSVCTQAQCPRARTLAEIRFVLPLVRDPRRNFIPHRVGCYSIKLAGQRFVTISS